MSRPDDDPVTRRPTVALGTAAVVAAIAVVLAIGPGSVDALAAGSLGAVVLAVGLVRVRRTAIDVGALVLFAAVVATGLEHHAVEPTIVGTIATVMAWDLGHGAVDLGEQLGREARTLRLEAVHVVSSLLVGLVSGTVGYAVYVVGAGGQPVAAVVLSLLAAVLIVVGLGSRRTRRGGRTNAGHL